jgi:hypothetical protein
MGDETKLPSLFPNFWYGNDDGLPDSLAYLSATIRVLDQTTQPCTGPRMSTVLLNRYRELMLEL